MKGKKVLYRRKLLYNNIRIKNGGSITVEAAFVMPVVVFTIFALIYLAFYLHDYSRLQGELDKVLHKSALTIKHEADIATGKVSYEVINDRGVFYQVTGNTKEAEIEIVNYLNQELTGFLFISKIINADVEAGKLNIKISIEAEAKIVLPYFQSLFDQFSSIKVRDSYPIHNPAETIRCVEVILDTGSDIKGVEAIKEKLESFMGSK